MVVFLGQRIRIASVLKVMESGFFSKNLFGKVIASSLLGRDGVFSCGLDEFRRFLNRFEDWQPVLDDM